MKPLLAVLTALAVTLSGAAGAPRPSERSMLTEALQYEREARATYALAVERFGDFPPFGNIVGSENIHVLGIERLMEARRIPIPADPFDDPEYARKAIKLPADYAGALRRGAEIEKEDGAYYASLLAFNLPKDMATEFEYQRFVSLERHLKAFERALNRGQGRRRR